MQDMRDTQVLHYFYIFFNVIFIQLKFKIKLIVHIKFETLLTLSIYHIIISSIQKVLIRIRINYLILLKQKVYTLTIADIKPNYSIQRQRVNILLCCAVCCLDKIIYNNYNNLNKNKTILI
jgi:hypothetical protein